MRKAWASTTAVAATLTLLGTAAFAANTIPGDSSGRPLAIVGGVIHPVSGPAIARGALLIEGGKIVALGRDVKLPENAEVIDATDKHVYPALFDACSNMGLIEINSVRGTVDHAETGQINPNVRAQVAVNPDSEIIPVTRSNGVLLAHVAPQGGLVAGQTAVLQLDGWTWEEMTLRGAVALHVNWPNMSPRSAWWEDKSNKEQVEQRDNQLAELEQALDDARSYQRARDAGGDQPFDSRWEAMRPVLTGELPLMVSADDLSQIQSAVAFAVRRQMKLIIYGGYDAPLCADLLKKHDVPVIVASVYRTPHRRSDPYDAPYTLPARLDKLGVKYCIAGGARFGASNVRNLPYHAATAVAFGLDRDEALRAITLYPAEILGVADRVGSLEVGKDATLFIADGDPLQTPTQVEAAFIQGRKVDLQDKHKRLWEKYQQRYQRQPAAE
ncbi:MAG: amidohydrolase family protein [Planctomycetales bacterium]|nr:amidohydrolase family protein [Planctomycetales bacterium]